MISIFIKEQKEYSKKALVKAFQCSEEDVIILIKKLKEYGILKINNVHILKDMDSLFYENIENPNVNIEAHNNYYVFTFVGVVIIKNYVLKCYPKYISKTDSPNDELKEILKVLTKYNSSEQLISEYNDESDILSYNILNILLFLLNDYYENGIYNNSKSILEINGSGEVYWDKTVNETFAIISNNLPYYTSLYTKRRTTNDSDYFRKLHSCILTLCSKELHIAGLLNLFEITPLNLYEGDLELFGETNYILQHIKNELNVEYNTRKKLLLKTFYAYIISKTTTNTNDILSVFGSTSFNLVWESVCSNVIGNQLYTPLESLNLPIPLCKKYNGIFNLIDVIEKPQWVGYKNDKNIFVRKPKKTLTPDIIRLYSKNNESYFAIFDAKYYTIQLEDDLPLGKQPGIGDVTKQYLYQLAYKSFLEDHNINNVFNCFLMPTEKQKIIKKGYVKMSMFESLSLKNIKVLELPARYIYSLYISGKSLDFNKLFT